MCGRLCTCLLSKERKGGRSQFFPPQYNQSVQNVIPVWLETCLRDYEKQALAYSLYRASLREDLSPAALAVQQKLGMNIYIRPALLLSDAKMKAGCSEGEMKKYLGLYYEKKTGSAMVINVDVVFTIQEMLLQMAKDEVKSLQGDK